MRKALMEDGMTDEQIMQIETSSVSERGVGCGLDPDDYDPTYDREVRLAIRENERKYIYNW